MRIIDFPYQVHKQWLMPIVPVDINYKGNWFATTAFVDSGATYSIFSQAFADHMGLNIFKGKKIYSQVGDGSLIPVYLYVLEIAIKDETIKATIGFSDKLGVSFNLLGRFDIFARFKVCFDDKEKLVTFTKKA